MPSHERLLESHCDRWQMSVLFSRAAIVRADTEEDRDRTQSPATGSMSAKALSQLQAILVLAVELQTKFGQLKGSRLIVRMHV
jgi:hypothetical protein